MPLASAYVSAVFPSLFSYENGILHINVPKKEEEKAKTQVNIK